jgi:hypothetical protein
VTKESGIASTYTWRQIPCELCKTPFPQSIIVNDKIVDLVEIGKPEEPHMIIETISRDRNQSKSIFVVKAVEGEVAKIGRGHETDIRVSDISVSRQHALIRFTKGEFYLDDAESKFGTLIQVKKPILLVEEQMVSV